MLLLACRSTAAKPAARALLALALREEHGLETLPTMAYGPLGKPFFPDRSDLHFSLSHSGVYALCALSDSPLGVDIEALRPRDPSLPRRVLTPLEFCWYTENGADWSAFYTLWTRKESLAKYYGGGIARPRLVLPPLPEETVEGLCITSFSSPGWRAALCGETAPPPLRWLAL